MEIYYCTYVDCFPVPYFHSGMGDNMHENDKTARAIRAHVRSILLRLESELRSSALRSKAQDRSVEVERQHNKPRRVNDL
jgi:hypothetical protein